MRPIQLLAQPVGMILPAIALLMEKFLPSTSAIDFTEGLLFGLSVVLNIYYIGIIFKRRNKIC